MKRHEASFRDPAGYIFRENGILYRAVHETYRPHYEQLHTSGLYQKLVEKEWLIETEECSDVPEGIWKVLRPEQLTWISYPYEWCQAMYKEAALRTLDILALSLRHDMILKDASAFNLQWMNGETVLIDSLSFERYQEGKPWQAYGQFCCHFLAPLALMSHVDSRLGRMMQQHIDGISLPLASSLLPWKTWLNPRLLIHLHLHARSIRKTSQLSENQKNKSFPRRALMELTDQLRAAIQALPSPQSSSHWENYYQEETTDSYLEAKQELVASWLGKIPTHKIWDIGANDGTFSRIAAEHAPTLAIEQDHESLQRLALTLQKQPAPILPIWLDLHNPSPALGWNSTEREGFLTRNRPDMILALALIHHLRITHQIPFEKMAAFFARLTKHLLIEYIPTSDPQVQRMLVLRESSLLAYDQAGFEAAFSRYFYIHAQADIGESGRILYQMERLPDSAA